MNTAEWNAKRELLEQAVIKSALSLINHTGSEDITLPIKNAEIHLTVKAALSRARGESEEVCDE